MAATLANMNQGVITLDAGGVVKRVINQRALELLDLPKNFAAIKITGDEIYQFQLEHGEFAALPKQIGEDFAKQFFSKRAQIMLPVYERERPNGTVLEIRTGAVPGGGE